MPLTGERTAPGVWHERYWYARHLAAYRWLAPRCAGRDVLEAGCGEGYGLDVVTAVGARAVGLDYDTSAVGHAARTHRGGYARANLVALPLADRCVDVALCLQVVEHIWTPHELLGELTRVLRPGGLLVLTTPNRPVFSPGLGRGERPVNPFHAREYDGDELAALVGDHLDVEDLLGLHAGPRLTGLDDRYAAAGGFAAAQLTAPPDRWDAQLADAVRATEPADFSVAPAAGGALDLLLLARRPA